MQDASPPEGELASAIDRDMGGLQKLQTKLSGMCAADQLQVCATDLCVTEAALSNKKCKALLCSFVWQETVVVMSQPMLDAVGTERAASSRAH